MPEIITTPNKELIEEVFSSEGYGTSMLVLAADWLGDDIFTMDPDTLETVIEERVGKPVSKSTIYRLIAAAGIVTSNLFWQDTVTFATVCRCLNGKAQLLSAVPDEYDLAWGIAEAAIIYGTEEKEEFAPNIKKYVRLIMREEGLTETPKIFRFAGKPEAPGGDVADAYMEQSRYERSRENADDVDYYVQENTIKLLKQLRALPVKYDTEAIKQMDEIINGNS